MLKENPEANINCSKLARIYGCDRRKVSKNIDVVKNKPFGEKVCYIYKKYIIAEKYTYYCEKV